LEFDQNILSKYHLKETSLYFKTKNKVQFIENIWCIHDLWKHTEVKYNAHCLSCHFNKHWVIYAIKTPLIFRDWLALISHVGVWSKYFVKIPFERNISLFQDKEQSTIHWKYMMHSWFMKTYWSKIQCSFSSQLPKFAHQPNGPRPHLDIHISRLDYIT
jgi:hypothetical protein